jgi:hypothetical protein
MNEETTRAIRNLNPTPAARVAMIIWGLEYSQQKGGSMDFWDTLSAHRQRLCELVVEDLADVFCADDD